MSRRGIKQAAIGGQGRVGICAGSFPPRRPMLKKIWLVERRLHQNAGLRHSDGLRHKTVFVAARRCPYNSRIGERGLITWIRAIFWKGSDWRLRSGC